MYTVGHAMCWVHQLFVGYSKVVDPNNCKLDQENDALPWDVRVPESLKSKARHVQNHSNWIAIGFPDHTHSYTFILKLLCHIAQLSTLTLAK